MNQVSGLSKVNQCRNAHLVDCNRSIGGHPFELGSTDWLYKGNIIEHLHESMLFLFFSGKDKQISMFVGFVCGFFNPRFL